MLDFRDLTIIEFEQGGENFFLNADSDISLVDFINGYTMIDGTDEHEINTDKLALVEAFAKENGLISSERELTEAFDDLIAPIVIENYGKDDYPAMREAFNNWTDSLCKDGELHLEQYENYVYHYYGKYINIFR